LDTVANLKNSRGKFFNEHKMPPDVNFWVYFFQTAGHPLPDRLLKEASEFKPERSNCPQLTLTANNIVETIPDEWRALARNVFVGRVLKGDVNAKAWTERQAGIIEINIQYSFTLTAYVSAYDEVFHLLKSFVLDVHAHRPGLEEILDELNERFSEPWSELDVAQREWIDHGLVKTSNPVSRQQTKDRESLHEDIVDSAESFVIAHELAHHLLGHTVSRRD
jgi:hypothetical protein